jgi:hypothetical protein
MRSQKMALAIAVAMALLTLVASADASPARRIFFPGRCRINIEVAPRQITAGDPVTIFGRLRCRRHRGEAGAVVKLFHHLPGSFGYGYVQSTRTDARGFYEFTRADGVVDSNRSWAVSARGTHSVGKRIRVAAQVTLSGPAAGTQLLTGHPNAVTFTGTVSPADVGARVILQRQNAATGGEWRRIDRGVVTAGGTFSIVHTFIVPGDANIRALVRSEGRNIPTASNELEYEISQAQNPALTIGASADPISFGQSVTIAGTLAGASGANQPVELLARTRLQNGFATIAMATTDASGNYAFPAQSPANSTFYKVATLNRPCVTPPNAVRVCMPPANSGPVTSAVLYEGVRDVLSAAVSATSVQAGGEVTFTGTVAPSHPGHVIYVERQNANDGGFHVVQVGVVNADSTYSIAHRVYDAGTKVFRVYIPGGPENEGAASAPFTIQVTPGPAAALTPEAPGNSSAPSEGTEALGETGEGAEGHH